MVPTGGTAAERVRKEHEKKDGGNEKTGGGNDFLGSAGGTKAPGMSWAQSDEIVTSDSEFCADARPLLSKEPNFSCELTQKVLGVPTQKLELFPTMGTYYCSASSRALVSSSSCLIISESSGRTRRCVARLLPTLLQGAFR